MSKSETTLSHHTPVASRSLFSLLRIAGTLYSHHIHNLNESIAGTIASRQPAFGRTGTCIIFAICTLMLCVACGPASTERDSDHLAVEAEQTALDYQNHQNLDLARSQLNDIEVANPNQWLILLTETSISQQKNLQTTRALVQLSLDLGLRSQQIQAYAVNSGIIAPTAEVRTAAAAQTEGVSVAQAGQQAVQPVVEPTATPVPPTPAPEPTAIPEPFARALNAINIRGGPGTNYNVVGGMQSGDELAVTGKNPTGDWWQVLLNSGQVGWVFGQLVETLHVETVDVAGNIPAPPPTPVPVPTTPPAVAPEAPEAPPVDTSNPHFTVTGKRLWGKQENDGCVGKHLLRIHVKDANGNPLNGVVLKGLYVGDEIATGEQGKGDGIMEYDLHGSGEGFTVIRDADGREASSDRAEGFTTRSIDIDKNTLIGAGYCTNDADCDVFYNSYGCHGHHSWEATFVRNY